MKDPFRFEYPDENPLTLATPEIFKCPECDADIEIWTDEVGRKCTSCKTYFRKKQQNDKTDALPKPVDKEKQKQKLQALIEEACKSGASKAAIISAKDIIVDQSLADRCREPKCSNYGLSKSCPPYVSGPSGFKNNLELYQYAIFFTIDVPSEILYSSDNGEIFQLLHQIAAGIEQAAVKNGFAEAQAYAGGSCKRIFCHDHPECQALSEKGECRHPEYARPSMSGFGIHVAKLFETCGWTGGRITNDTDSGQNKTESVCGLVLIG